MTIRRSAAVLTVLALSGAAAHGAVAATPTKPQPNIEPGALTLADLPGAKVTRQEYVKDTSTLASYQREFDLGAKPYGSSQLMNLESDVDLYASASEAALTVELAAAVLDARNPAAKKAFAEKFAGGAGFKPTSIVPLRNLRLKLGSAPARLLMMRIGTPIGRYDVAFLFVQAGKLAGSVFLQGEPSAPVALADVERLATAFAARLAATAKSLAAPKPAGPAA